MSRIALLAAVAALPLAACSSEPDTPTEDPVVDSGPVEPVDTAATDPGTPTVAMDYVRMAGAGDMFEIESSRLALEKSQSEGVKSFAQMMIDHHTKSTADVGAAAEAAGLTPPAPALSPAEQQMLDRLRGLSGAEFDTLYLSQQADAHRMALNLHRTYAETGDTTQLREAAGKIATAVEQHIAELRGLQTP